MKRKILIFLFLAMFLSVGFNDCCYSKAPEQLEKEAVAKEAKKLERQQKIDETTKKVKEFFTGIVPAIKAKFNEIDFDTTTDFSLVFPINFEIKGRKFDLSMGFEWTFDEAGVGDDPTKGFTPMRAVLISPSLNSILDSFGIGEIPGDIGRMGLLNALLGIDVPKDVQKAVATATGEIKKAVGVDVEPVLQFLRDLAIVKPEMVFLLKTIILFGSYTRDGKISQIPVQMGLLFARLMNTVDEQATIAANDGEVSQAKWKPGTKVYFKGPEKLLTILPKQLKDILADIKPEVNEVTYQEYLDRKSGPSVFQKAYSDVREQRNYDYKVALTYSDVLPLINSDLNFTDQGLFVYLLQRLIFERGYAKRDTTIPKLSFILKEGLNKLQAIPVGNEKFSQPYRSQRIQTINDLISRVKRGASESEEKWIAIEEIEIDGQPVEEKKESKLGPVLPAPSSKYKKRIPLIEYLQYLYDSFNTMLMQKKFPGDPGYLFDDSILSYDGAAFQLAAILLRAIKDLNKAVSLCGSENPTLKYKGSTTLAKNIYLELVGKPAKMNAARTKIEQEGTRVQGMRDEAFVKWKKADAAYRFAVKQKESKDDISIKQKTKNKELNAYLKAAKDLLAKQLEYKTLVLKEYKFRRATDLNERTIEKKLRDKIQNLTDKRPGENVTKAELVRQVQELVHDPDYAVDQTFLDEMDALGKETVWDFLRKEIIKLSQRTAQFDLIKSQVEPYIKPLGMSFDDLLGVVNKAEAKEIEAIMDEEYAEEPAEEEVDSGDEGGGFGFD